MPAVVYGKGTDPVAISLNNSDILRTYRKAGQASIIDLDIDGKVTQVLIHQMQIHPVKEYIEHVDFMAINPKEKIVASVPVRTTGVSPAIRNLGGILMVEHRTVQIRCLPADIPTEFMIDISTLKHKGAHVQIKDLTLDPAKHEVMGLEPGAVVVSITGKGGGKAAAEDGEGAEGEAAEGEVAAE